MQQQLIDQDRYVPLRHETQIPTQQDIRIPLGDASLSHFIKCLSSYDLVSFMVSNRTYEFMQYRYTMWLLHHIYHSKLDITRIVDGSLMRIGQDLASLLPYWIYHAYENYRVGKTVYVTEFPRDVTDKKVLELSIREIPKLCPEEPIPLPMSYDPDCELLGGGGDFRVYDKMHRETVVISVPSGCSSFHLKDFDVSPRVVRNIKKYKFFSHTRFSLTVHGDYVDLLFTFFDGNQSVSKRVRGEEEAQVNIESVCEDLFSGYPPKVQFDFNSSSSVLACLSFYVCYTNNPMVMVDSNSADKGSKKDIDPEEVYNSVPDKRDKIEYDSDSEFFTDTINYKGKLNETATQMHLGVPEYKVTRTGLDHQPVFKGEVRLHGRHLVCKKKARTKILAEQCAAREMLRNLGKPVRPPDLCFKELESYVLSRVTGITLDFDYLTRSVRVKNRDRSFKFDIVLSDNIKDTQFKQVFKQYSLPAFERELISLGGYIID